MVHGLGLLDIRRGLADHHPELDFPVGLDRAARNAHIVVRSHDGRSPLVEHHRLLRNRHVRFRGVVGVVQAYADKLADAADAGAQARLALDARQCGQVQRLELLPGRAGQEGAIDVGGQAGEIADMALLVQDSGLLLTRGSVAQQLHITSPYASLGWSAV
ncbi:hypothetical protein D3C71_1680770 [compost metagenome]